MDWSTVVSTIFGVIAGGAINAFFSWRGSKELRREAGNLKQLTQKLMLMMDDAELIRVEWGEDGNPVRVVELSGRIDGSSNWGGELEVGQRDEVDRREGS